MLRTFQALKCACCAIGVALISSVAVFAARIDYPLPLVLAVEESPDVALFSEAVDATIALLEKRFTKQNILVKRLDSNALLKELKTGRIDFLLVDPLFLTMHRMAAELTPMASLWPQGSSGPTEVVGSLYFTLASNRDIESVDQLSRRSLAVTSPDSFSGWYSARHDIQQRGYQANHFFELVTFYGADPMGVIEAVLSRKTHAGVLPACQFETLLNAKRIDAKKFKMLGLRKPAFFRCASSTNLYPGPLFLSTNNAGAELVQLVNHLLRDQSGVFKRFSWTAPVSTRPVYDMLFDLKVGPYANQAQWTFERFVREQSGYFVAILIFITMGLTYSTLVSYVARNRTMQLRRALLERDRIEKEAIASRDRIAGLERAGLVGQMSTMIAHELKQPIGAITNFANGMLRRIRRGNVDEATLIQALEEIVEQGSRASEIVNRVRSYAKQKTPELKVEDLSAAVDMAIENFKRSRRSEAVLEKVFLPYLWAEIDSWEIELAVLNLLKNAADSVKTVPNPQIRVSILEYEEYWRVEICDNGPQVTQQRVDEFMLMMVTTKENGLGLGLSLVASIAERQHGRLVGFANADRGVSMCLDIPRLANTVESEGETSPAIDR